jgi:cytochrome c553
MKSARRVLWILAPLLAAGASLPAWSQEQAAVRSLVAACFTCHGTDGRSVGGVPPALAGLDRQYLLQTLKDFKAGKRPATIMHQQAKGYTDQELEIMAGYFAGVKPGPAPTVPSARY